MHRPNDYDLVKNLGEADLATGAVAAVVSIDVKADETAVHHLAKNLRVPARFFDAATLEKKHHDFLIHPTWCFAKLSCHGVAEAAALAAAGPDSRLIVPKQKARGAPVAVVLATRLPAAQHRSTRKPIHYRIGPGTALWRTPEATIALPKRKKLSATDFILI